MDITNAIDYIKNMQLLQQRKENLENEIGSLESERDDLVEITGSLKNLSHKAYRYPKSFTRTISHLIDVALS